jgi:hypothetical protein
VRSAELPGSLGQRLVGVVRLGAADVDTATAVLVEDHVDTASVRRD